ncbi:unnamed protein product [Caenorhabditis angaria]|uniref:Uncharacterized protein n=1 Tax=Caenorhabditis angaria TaxID=860376 RepID=A0A9P1IJ74_9PELO|nr:unnamed protein product [Caenorhabditis angaria]
MDEHTQFVEGTVEVKSALEYGRSILFSVLDSLDGDKTIVWDRDRSLMHRVNLFAGASLLATHGVVANHGIETRKRAETPHVVFFLSPTIISLDLLCDYIDNVQNDPKTLYQVFFIPEAWYVVREKLKLRENGKYWERLESVKEIPLCWLPRDGECLSLSQPQIASKLLLNGDWTPLHKCATALNQLIDMSRGDITINPNQRVMTIYSRGKWSQDVAKMVQRIRTSTEVTNNNIFIPGVTDSSLKINRIVIIDRWIDPLTPMLTQLTYSGLLDEMFKTGMVNSIKVPLGEFEEKDDADPFDSKEIYLTDEIYHRLKHSHINCFGQEAAKILTELKEDEQFDREKMSVAEYAVLVKKMPRILKRKQFTSTHMRLAEMTRMHLYCKLSDTVKNEKELLEVSDGDKILPFLEDQIFDAAPLYRILRLISVHSLTSGGLKPSVLQQYRRAVNQSYGSSALNKILKMQKMGLIREKGGSGKMSCEYAPILFQQMKKQYDMLPQNVNEMKLDDPSYAYSGFTPLLVKIIEEGDKVRWTGWQKTIVGAENSTTKNDVIADSDSSGTCIFVLGGITRAETAIIKESLPNVSLITTSAMLTGDKILENITNI